MRPHGGAIPTRSKHPVFPESLWSVPKGRESVALTRLSLRAVGSKKTICGGLRSIRTGIGARQQLSKGRGTSLKSVDKWWIMAWGTRRRGAAA